MKNVSKKIDILKMIQPYVCEACLKLNQLPIDTILIFFYICLVNVKEKYKADILHIPSCYYYNIRHRCYIFLRLFDLSYCEVQKKLTIFLLFYTHTFRSIFEIIVKHFQKNFKRPKYLLRFCKKNLDLFFIFLSFFFSKKLWIYYTLLCTTIV